MAFSVCPAPSVGRTASPRLVGDAGGLAEKIQLLRGFAAHQTVDERSAGAEVRPGKKVPHLDKHLRGHLVVHRDDRGVEVPIPGEIAHVGEGVLAILPGADVLDASPSGLGLGEGGGDKSDVAFRGDREGEEPLVRVLVEAVQVAHRDGRMGEEGVDARLPEGGGESSDATVHGISVPPWVLGSRL